MLYFSTNKSSKSVNFREATITGQAPDKGLYFPEFVPKLSENFLKNFKSMSNADIAFELIKPYVGDEIPTDDLMQICSETVDFEIPLKRISDKIWSLELFHGPTLAFKDVGARFMSRCLRYFAKQIDKKITVLVATSGDTGSAVANGFLGIDGVEVVILYPSGKVSTIQELQLTTLGQNITALEVQGKFDDCQALVKQAFMDSELNENLFLTSANSINIARWLSQQFYYAYALKQWNLEELPVISVPSGNFGNICAGLLASESGLAPKHFIAACNANDVFTKYLETKKYEIKDTIPTISNAMDVGNPSNFVRILELFGHDFSKISEAISSVSISDSETEQTISKVYKNFNYLLDPHGAVAYTALENYLENYPNEAGFILETAHPIKFLDTVERVINQSVKIPDNLTYLLKLKKNSTLIKPNFEDLKAVLLKS